MRTLLLVWVSFCIVACGHADQSSSTLSEERESAQFPVGPDKTKTPGTLCTDPDTYRYPERIPYCERDVSTGTKRLIIADYDREFGFNIGAMNRADFKIDHYIPLCMGGSNAVTNLWPQHKSVYVKTDLIEQRSCELMALGRLKQVDAVKMIRKVKNDLSTAPQVLAQLEDQLAR